MTLRAVCCCILLFFLFTPIVSFSSSSDKKPPVSRIGVITSGGDCPSLNACIRAIVKTASAKQVEVWGLPIGFPGLLQDPPRAFRLDDDGSYASVDMLRKGGSRLGGFVKADYAPQFDSMTLDEKAAKISASLEKLGIDGIIATGGDTSFDRIATLLQHNADNSEGGGGGKDNIGVVGIPKTIDNDVQKTIYSLGFQSAVSVAANAISNVRDTAQSHRRVIVVECMGREAGFLTLHAGIAGGADAILLPETTLDTDELLRHIRTVYEENQCGIVAVSESIALPETGEASVYTTADGSSRLGGSAEVIARFIAESLNVDARHLVLGHLQRGGSPNAFDQVLATTLGSHAVNALCGGTTNAFVNWNGTSVETVPLSEVRGVESKCITATYPELIAAQSMGIYCGTVIC